MAVICFFALAEINEDDESDDEDYDPNEDEEVNELCTHTAA